MGVTKTKDQQGDDGIMRLSVINGSFRQTVTEETPDAEKREYEDANKNIKVKWEIHYSKVNGTLSNVEFKDGTFGE